MSQRQLAAIMFTDIVGYTSLMGQDSEKALELVRIKNAEKEIGGNSKLIKWSDLISSPWLEISNL